MVVIVLEFFVTNSTDVGNVAAFLVNSGQHVEWESRISVHHSCGIHWLEMAVVICKILFSVF